MRDLSTGLERFTLPGRAGPRCSAVFSPDGKRIASAGADWSVRMWDLASGHQIFMLTQHAGRVGSVAFSVPVIARSHLKPRNG